MVTSASSSVATPATSMASRPSARNPAGAPGPARQVAAAHPQRNLRPGPACLAATVRAHHRPGEGKQRAGRHADDGRSAGHAGAERRHALVGAGAVVASDRALPGTLCRTRLARVLQQAQPPLAARTGTCSGSAT
ncbi:hypothetical protein G6F31_016661 [Rhizopus arrhizus]|nr:hypothetical protein G6F31_016661 [Rhizopus arrhizus]